MISQVHKIQCHDQNNFFMILYDFYRIAIVVTTGLAKEGNEVKGWLSPCGHIHALCQALASALQRTPESHNRCQSGSPRLTSVATHLVLVLSLFPFFMPRQLCLFSIDKWVNLMLLFGWKIPKTSKKLKPTV